MIDNFKISLFEQGEDNSIFIKECENWEEAEKEMMATAKKNPDKIFKLKGFVKQEDGSVKLQLTSYRENDWVKIEHDLKKELNNLAENLFSRIEKQEDSGMIDFEIIEQYGKSLKNLIINADKELAKALEND